MKKYFIPFLLAALMSMVGTKAFAHDIEVKNAEGKTIYYVWKNNKTELAVSYLVDYDVYLDRYTGNVIIPESVNYEGNTYRVRSIGDYAFYGCQSLTSVTIPNSVTSIGKWAFYGCHSLTSVTIPNSVTSIGETAFENCSSLTSITIPNSVTNIGDEAFDYCRGLTSVTIGNSVTSIGNYAFECCSLTSIISLNNTPPTCTQNYLGNYTQFDYVDKTNCIVWVPKGSANAYKAANGWNNFQNIVEYEKKRTIHVTTAGTLPDLISDYDKSLIEELTLTGNLNGTDIACIRRMAGAAMNYDYDNVKEVVAEKEKDPIYGKLHILDISNATIVSGGGAYMQFWHKPSYSPYYDDLEISIYTSNNTISDFMFDDCKFTKVYLPSNITSIGYGAFSGCSGLTSIMSLNNTPPTCTQDYYGSYTQFESVDKTNCIVWVPKGSANAYKAANGWKVFQDIREINDQTCGENLTWSYAEATKTLTISGTGAMTNYSSNNRPWNSYVSSIQNLIIESGVTSIGETAFYDCKGLTSITIPNTVTSIGDCAFDSCSGLTSVTIPNSVTSIGVCAFLGCSGLTSIKVPNSLISIGGTAFGGCSGLTSITIGKSVTSIDSWAFKGCSGLTSIISLNNIPPTCTQYYGNYTQFNSVDKSNCVLWVPKGSANAYREADGWQDFNNIRELIPGDANVDGVVNVADVVEVVNAVNGKPSDRFLPYNADQTGNGVDANDVKAIVDIIMQK